VLESLISEVLRASGMDLVGRAEVEADLRAHFEDGLDAGVPLEVLASRFGDAAEAGRSIAGARRRHGPGGTRGRGRWWRDVGELIHEARHAARRLARAPGFTAIVLLTLALGIGANAAVFTVLDAVLLEPLPYHDPGRLVRVYESPPEGRSDTGDRYLRAPTVAAYRGWTDIFQSFGALFTYREEGVDLTDGDQPQRLTVVPVTAGYFETLGVSPVLGRTFTEDETFAEGADQGVRGVSAPAVVLGNRLWEDLFGADPDAVGRTVHLNDVAYEVVGVMPPGYRDPFGPEADAWVPQSLASNMDNWGNFYLSGVARLPEGMGLEAAQERATTRYRGLAEANPEAGDWGPWLVPLHADVVGPTRGIMLWVLAGAAGLVLLTACLNVANLVLARGVTRDRDVALRSALGSGRARIVVGALAENGLLALAGGAAGLLLGWGGVRGLLSLAPDAIPAGADPELGARVFLFTSAVTGLALLAFGLAPALRMAGTPPAEVLRSGDRTSTGGRAARRIRDALVVVQVAAALVLVTGASLLTRSFGAILDVPLAVEPQGVLTFEVNLPPARYADGPAREAFHRRLQTFVEALPGVEAAGAVSWLPVSGRYHIWTAYWDPEDPSVSYANRDAWHATDVRVFAGDYLRAVGIDVVQGRGPGEVDLEGEPVAWVSRAFAREVFGDRDPTGQVIGVADARRRVAGVVEDVPVDARGRVTRHVYVPHAQFSDNRNWALVQTVRARADLLGLQAAIREEIRSLDPGLVLHRPRLLAEVVGSSRAQDRFAVALMGAFALLALTLSLVGTYGVLAGTVAARRREMGIRIALGADGSRIRGMVLRYATALTLPGVLLGLGAAAAGSRLLDSLLFGVGSRDPATYTLSGLLFLGVGLLAGWIPARRAARVDPARTLAEE
jgi:predicted permease